MYATTNPGDGIKLTYYNNGKKLSTEILALSGRGTAYLARNDFDRIEVQATGSDGHFFSTFTVAGNDCSIDGMVIAQQAGCAELGFDIPDRLENQCGRDKYMLNCRSM